MHVAGIGCVAAQLGEHEVVLLKTCFLLSNVDCPHHG